MRALPPYKLEVLHPDECVQGFQRFLEDHCVESLEAIMNELDDSVSYGLEIDVSMFLDTNQILGTLLLAHPRKLLPLLDQAIGKAQQTILQHNEFAIPKSRVCARLTSLPLCEEVSKPNVSCIRNSDIEAYISFPGTVIRTGSVRTLEWERWYECPKCGHQFATQADLEQWNTIPVPHKCPECDGHKIKQLTEKTVARDFQELKVQEKVQKLNMGSIPRSMTVIIMDDLVDTCKAGDDVQVGGLIVRRWRSVSIDTRCDLEMTMLANSLRVANENKAALSVTEENKRGFKDFWAAHKNTPMAAHATILRAVCPQLCGLFLAKLAVLLTLIGGVTRSEKGTRVRGEGHILLIGDPGTGKSQLLKFAARLSSRSVVTSGIGATGAGLTVTAAKESGGEWTLEAGALVLADGGLCCIDEFDAIREHDRATIHEAMEQQTISVAKAGLVCKLQTRCSVLATTNPKIKGDLTLGLPVACGIASPLLSRFDIILVMRDDKDAERDARTSGFILDLHAAGGRVVNPDGKPIDSFWSLERLQVYVAHVKETIDPSMLPEAQAVLSRYYTVQRQRHASAARTTIRLLESLVRLAQAHARLMYHQDVTRQDAVMAVYVIEASTQAPDDEAPIFSTMPNIHDFPSNEEADIGYDAIERQVSAALGLSMDGDLYEDSPTSKRPRMW